MSAANDSLALQLTGCAALGASGFPFSAGDAVEISFYGNYVTCTGRDTLARFHLLEVVDFSITGPGSVTKGGGFIGGGFGVEGALEGMVIAGILNKLTTETKIHTFLTLTTNWGELHLHYGLMEPASLRIYLSGVFVRLRQLNSRWMLERDQEIAAHLASGAIASEEADAIRSRLFGPPAWQDLRAEAEARQRLEEAAFNEAAKGLCPNCDKAIPLASETCKFCNANFGEYASWKVLPMR